MDIINEIWQRFDAFDKRVFLFLNQIHNSDFDIIMFWISNRWIWIPLYLFLLGSIFYSLKKISLKLIIVISILIAFTDLTCSWLLKPTFKRLRPCHQTELQSTIHIVKDCGGQYGFASSHSGNTFAIATFIYLWFRKKKQSYLMFLWASIVSYSRIYLGVHFPLDILIGASIGIFYGNIIYKFCPNDIKIH